MNMATFSTPSITHCTPFKTTCGGQALLEGILMQGPEKRAIVVRKPDGELSVEEEASGRWAAG